MPRNMTLNETNYNRLFDMSVKRPHGWALANESGHLFQTFSRQSIHTYMVRIVAQNSNIQGPLLKMNVLSRWKYALHQTQP